MTLNEHLDGLRAAVEEHRAASRKAETYLAEQIEKLWDDSAERRDELHAVANRVESLTRLVAPPFECVPDESGGVRDDAA